MRVEVKIPGGVKTHVIDERGKEYPYYFFKDYFSNLCRVDATDALWAETYLSSIIRSILYADDEAYRITGYRRLNPIPNKAAEKRFLDAVERLFSSGKSSSSNF